MKKLDFNSLKIKTPIEKEYMDNYKEIIRELRQRLYKLMRENDGTT